ncbi:hypothetical protein SAMN04490357_6877 [Streptomyces misionensis]|uniref:Uncharacterized protein n=1 Tax=Streptomyces misionensis TaxID=67331 RepID=A0A1H5G022_9ACTN|nr:hypothetical protein SAMN04490357_6877 [Streptomyces misionensis]
MEPWVSDEAWPDGGSAPSWGGAPLTAQELREYATEIGSLGPAGSPEPRFRRYRDGRLLLVGAAGPLSAALLSGALRAGCRDIGVVGADPSDPGLTALVERARRDGAQRVRPRPDLDLETPGAADVVLHLSGSLRELAATAERCAATGVFLGQALIGDDELWTGPLGPAARTAVASAWRRLRGVPRRTPVADGGRPAEIAAGQLLRAWFAWATGTARPAGAPYLLRTELPHGTTVPHRILPLPAAPRVTEVRARAAFLGRQGGEAVDAGELCARADAVTDPRTGLLGTTRCEEITLGAGSRWECRTAVADPLGARPAGTPDAVVTGHGGDRETARVQTLLTALAAYGTLVAYGCRAARARDDGADAWGLDLVTGALRRVPVRDAHPAPDGEVPYRPPVGAAAGLTWAHAVEAGLAQHCEELLSRRLADRATRVPRLPLPADEAPGTAHPLSLLRALGEPVAHDLSALLSVPACGVRLGSRTALAVGATRVEAMRTAAERALLAQRLPAGAVPAITPEQERPAEFFPKPRGTAGRPRFAEALRAQGRTPVAVLLDHDPQAAVVLPYVVQVILADV